MPQAGRNYGWPVITYGRGYDKRKFGEGTKKPGLEQPIYYWDPSISHQRPSFTAEISSPNGRATYLSVPLPVRRCIDWSWKVSRLWVKKFCSRNLTSAYGTCARGRMVPSGCDRRSQRNGAAHGAVVGKRMSYRKGVLYPST